MSACNDEQAAPREPVVDERVQCSVFGHQGRHIPWVRLVLENATLAAPYRQGRPAHRVALLQSRQALRW